MGCENFTYGAQFLDVPKEQLVIVHDVHPECDEQFQHVGRTLIVAAMTADIVFTEEEPEIAFGHDQVIFIPPRESSSAEG